MKFQELHVYETFTSKNTSPLSKLPEKLEYKELALKYQDISPVYTKLLQ